MILDAKDYMKIPGSIALKLCFYLVAIAAVAAPAMPATLSAAPAAVDFQYSPGETQPQPVIVTVTASDGSSPALTVTLTPGAGTPSALFPQPLVAGDTMQVYYNNATFETLVNQPGTYTAAISVSASGFTALTVPVTFTIGAAVSILPSPASLTFTVPPGPAVQTVALAGNNGLAVGFSVSVSTTTGGNWLTAAANASFTPATLTVTVNADNDPAGTYQGSFAITPATGAVVTIPITFQVGTNALSASPASMAFNYTVGGTTPPAQVLQLSSAFSNDTYAAQAASTGNWLLLNGVTTQISGSLPASLNVTVKTAGLAAGNYEGSITATDADGGAQTIAVTLVVGGISSIANPSSLTFVAQEGGSPPAGQTLVVASIVNTSYTVTLNQTWLSVSAASGPPPSDLTVTANPTGLKTGTYIGEVQIKLGANVQDVQVTLIVSAGAVLNTTPGSFIFNYFGGDTPPAPLALDVNVSSLPPQSFTVAGGVPSWLQIAPSGSSLTTPTTLTVGLAPQTLASGTYVADIILTPAGAGGVPVVVPVLLTVESAIGVVSNPASLSFSAAAGGAPLSQTIAVTASSATAFTASASTASGSWLSVSPTSGIANTLGAALTVTADATHLAEGAYQGTVTLTTSGGVVTLVPVAFAVAASSGSIAISPSTLAFTYTLKGAVPAAQSVQIAGAQSFTASAATTTGGAWLAVTPTSGTGNATLSVSVSPAALAAGTYSGSITVTPAAGAAQVVAVTLTVSAAASLNATPNPLAFAYTAGNPPPAAQTVSVTATGPAVAFTATAASTGWLSVTQSAATTPSTLTVSANPANLGAGSYAGSVTLSGGSGTLQLTINVALTVTAPTPNIGAVVNAASYLTGGVSPGEIVTIFGTSLGPATGVSSTVVKGYIPTTVANATVTFNGYPGPILYASALQINAIVPYELAGSSNVSIEVTFGSARSNSPTLAVVSSAPGIFSADGSGKGAGAILDTNYNLVSTGNPVSAGSAIQIFATGEGQTAPGGVDGLIEPLSLPLPAPLLAAAVTIGGVAADILYVGAAPGLVAGALQVNVIVPPGVAAGPAPLFLSFGGIDNSQAGITVNIK